MIPSLQLAAYEPPDPERMAWQDRGACRGADPDLFFPTKNRTAHAAKRICAGCDADVRAACLAYALDNEPEGVWGGTSPKERQGLRNGRPLPVRRPPPPCGTESSYKRHRRLGEPDCAVCRLAANAVKRERKAQSR